MPGNKPSPMSRSSSEDRFDEMPDEIPAALLNALFEEESTGRKLPRAVMVGKDEVVVYQVCKIVSADDLSRLDELTTCVARMENIESGAAKNIHKVILAASCDEDIRLRAENGGIHVLTKDELVHRRNTLIH
jgi:hypothetical protein